jgi:hypothetical protein
MVAGSFKKRWWLFLLWLSRAHRRRFADLPLPAGEGWGEGEFVAINGLSKERRPRSADFTLLHSSFCLPFPLACQHESDSLHG